MRAIPTIYAGNTFRSRLEAGVARHLDKLSLPWQYEPEGFELDDGTRYLPDFYLPTARAWMEVKGPHYQRIDKLEKFADQLWREADERNPPMVILATVECVEQESRDFYHGGREHLRLIGITGVNRGISVLVARCPCCGARTIMYCKLGISRCRSCGADTESMDSDEAQYVSDSVFECLRMPFRRMEPAFK